MRKIIHHLIIGAVLLLAQTGLAQNNNCTTVIANGQTQGQVFFNYGSVSNAENVSYKSNFTIGQVVVGPYSNGQRKGNFGFWGRFLLPPAAPYVRASEGDLADRIEINWTPDPLSPKASSYKLYRDGALLGQFDNETFSYIDFNVIAGNFYEYSVVPKNSLGTGSPGKALGFLNPNGVVTGQVQTFSGNPVYGAVVTLEPSLGSALYFNGSAMAFVEDDTVLRSSQFTVSCWVKLAGGNTGKGILDFGSDQNKNWWLHTNAAGNGVKFSIGNGTGSASVEHAFTADINGWHFVAATFNGTSLLLYVDGNLVQTTSASVSTGGARLLVGQKPSGSNYDGLLDEVRYFNRQLSQTELNMFMNRTVSVGMNGLKGYWKMDEGIGQKAFGQAANRQTMYLCGTQWTADRPQVINAAVTGASGFYEIAGVNYGPGTTFTAKASKNSYFNQSLEFNGANQQYADLTNFDLPDSSTILLTVKPFDFTTHQTILSKADAGGNHLFSVNINNGNLELTMGLVPQNLGPLGMGFHHLGFTFKQSGPNVEVNYYKDGAFVGTYNYNAAPTDLNGLPWKVGARANGTTNHGMYLTGLVDEVAFYNTLLSLSEIQTSHNIGTNSSDIHLLSWFNFNEGVGTVLHDMGQAMTGDGATQGAGWSSSAAITDVLPHEFNPTSRLVTLNPSNTSTDGVDFYDESTIPVSGYVRFEGTTCFQEGVEILVNGLSYTPAIFTDAEGKFVADFEPGVSVTLTPKVEGHSFIPAKWDIQNLTTPVAGILFRNQTKRKVTGQLAGGLCRKSVIPVDAMGNPTAIVKVKVATLDGCFEKVQTLTNPNGKFTFDGIPPDSVTVAVIEHSNPIIYTYFQNQGGITTDLREKNDTVDFIYFAPPQVEMSPLPLNACNQAMIEPEGRVTTTIKVYEDYDGGRCYLDTALLHVDNDIARQEEFDTLMTGGKFVYKFSAGAPNIVSPYKKVLQVTTTVHDELATGTLEGVVLGIRPRTSAFVSAAPEFPDLILRDPPGDASYATLEQGTTTCKTITTSDAITLGGGAHVTVHLGPDINIEMGTPFLSKETQFDFTADLGYQVSYIRTDTRTDEMERCITTTKTISTSDADLIVGSEMGGDIYMGGAMNYLYSITDILKWDTMGCSFFLDKSLTVTPEGYATTFIYTEYHILNNVIPDLYALQTQTDSMSARTWQSIVDSNTVFKQQAVFEKNLSFNGGVVYEESTTTEETSSVSFAFETEFSNTFSADFGLTVDGVGLTGGAEFSFAFGESEDTLNSTLNSKTVTYVLADDDIGDNFSVDIKKDKRFGTPVFKTVAGQSQCPHEPKTQPREGVDMSANQTSAVNVPMNDVAVFQLTLGNTSQSEDLKTYTLEVDQSTNPNGAVIRFNGLPSLGVAVPYGEGVPVTMTVERGPLAFDYEDISVEFFSDCEDERATALGFFDTIFNKELVFDIHFLEPCSPVDLAFPLEGWVLTPAMGVNLNTTLAMYDKNDPDLELVRVQYRRTNGDGAWINIAEILKADLGPVFTNVGWNTTGLQDGLYEIRAITQCFGAQNPGISHIIHGKIERTPPVVLGIPEPADGVLSAGDEISITFNEPIRCDLLIQADFFSNNNVGLYDTATDELIDATITCSGDKIIIVPNVPNQLIENKILRVEVDSVLDLAGNKFGHIQWEFFVDRNPMRWVGGELEANKFEDEFKTVYKTILNTGGASQYYEIEDVPSWVFVYPSDGVLDPGQQQVITFEFDSTLVVGEFLDTLVMNTANGDEPLYIDFRNLCRSPQWEVNPANFSYSMNLTVQLDIEGTLSTDDMDIVAAFVNDTLRGMAYLQYVPAVDKYEAFLTVYSNNFTGDTIKFQIWDADVCLLYSDILEKFVLTSDELVGTPLLPVTLHTDNLLLRKIPLHGGWNWISFNLGFPDPSLNPALSSLATPENDLIKSQTQFANYYGTPINGWLGSLTALGNLSMYQFRADVADTLDLVGHPIDPTTPIPLVAGWNWIGYLPLVPIPVNDALASLTSASGDVIKSQSAFAQYVAGFGWLGNLDYLKPAEGYLLKKANPGTLNYPHSFQGGTVEDRSGPSPNNSPWTVDPSQYEHTMILVGMVAAEDGSNITGEGQTVAAFVNGEVRGVADALYIEPMHAYLFFLTMYANQSGELVQFKLYDATSEEIVDLDETMFFSIDHQEGTVETPYPFVMHEATGTFDLAGQGNELIVQPNPFSGSTNILFHTQQTGTATLAISDALGRVVLLDKMDAIAGWNSFLWEAAGLPAGVYFVKVEMDGVMMTRRVVKR
ncbi:MAG: T9SS type A sorting domain-containing protein [Lewinellaceae bacterium]|nr:T9SS type A sorting domain-containing protein [Saprospiraceae bacterium]MCB9337442.1 T9SS type A sorting domain-containing protein [Lewinellaceae bacterium]